MFFLLLLLKNDPNFVLAATSFCISLFVLLFENKKQQNLNNFATVRISFHLKNSFLFSF
jgi:hypothetical protein